MTYQRAQTAFWNGSIEYFYGCGPVRGRDSVDRNCDEHGLGEMKVNKFYLRLLEKRQLIIDEWVRFPIDIFSSVLFRFNETSCERRSPVEYSTYDVCVSVGNVYFTCCSCHLFGVSNHEGLSECRRGWIYFIDFKGDESLRLMPCKLLFWNKQSVRARTTLKAPFGSPRLWKLRTRAPPAQWHAPIANRTNCTAVQ